YRSTTNTYLRTRSSNPYPSFRYLHLIRYRHHQRTVTKRPAYTRLRRGGWRRISPSCRTHESPTSILQSAVVQSPLERVHAPIITCLAESNPPRPTRLRRPGRRLRRNREPSKSYLTLHNSPRRT